jgi:hypothetical protein
VTYAITCTVMSILAALQRQFLAPVCKGIAVAACTGKFNMTSEHQCNNVCSAYPRCVTQHIFYTSRCSIQTQETKLSSSRNITTQAFIAIFTLVKNPEAVEELHIFVSTRVMKGVQPYFLFLFINSRYHLQVTHFS